MTEATRREVPQKVAQNIQAWFQEMGGRVKDYRTNFNQQESIRHALETGRSFLENQYRGIRRDLENAAERGKSIQNQARRQVDHFRESSREWMEFSRFREEMEKRINKRLETLPRLMNLPERRDVDNLFKAVKALNKKVDALARAMKR